MEGLLHTGSCHGRGLWVARDYHGYRRVDDDGKKLEVRDCPCCRLECQVCMDEPGTMLMKQCFAFGFVFSKCHES